VRGKRGQKNVGEKVTATANARKKRGTNEHEEKIPKKKNRKDDQAKGHW